MPQHPNARLAPKGRALLCERVGGGMRIADAAAMAGVSRQTAHKCLARARRGEPMTDRGCRPRRLARLTPPEAEARVAEARTRLLLAPLALSAETGVPARAAPGSWPAGACRVWTTSTASRASRAPASSSGACATSASTPGS